MPLLKPTAAWKRYIPLWQEAVFPLCFALTGLLHFFLFYLGLAFEENAARETLFAVGCALYAVVCGLSFLRVIKERLLPGKTWVLLALPALFFGACFLLRMKEHGLSGGTLSAAGQFVVLCVPAFFAGVCCAARRKEAAVFPLLDKMSFLALPAVIVYVNGALFHCNPFGWNQDFGILSYMTFAYALMPFLLAQLLCFCGKEPLHIPFYHKEVRHPQWIRGGMIVLFWTAIIASGTRGAYFCVIGFCILLVLFRLRSRNGTLKRAGAAALAVTAMLLFSIFVYAPKGFHVGRMETFLEGLMQGQIITDSGQNEDVDQYLDDLVAADGGEQVVNRPDKEPPQTEPTPPEEVTPPEETMPPEEEAPPEEMPPPVSDMNLQIGNRGTLYKLAMMEFMKSPVTGMGPGNYTLKYGKYPHNVLLELLCETGLAGTIPLVTLILWAVIRLLLIGRKRPEVSSIVLIFAAFAIQACISGSLWNCPALLCALGYGLAALGKEPEKTL